MDSDYKNMDSIIKSIPKFEYTLPDILNPIDTSSMYSIIDFIQNQIDKIIFKKL
jgi:hemerythrin-like domain-containing protein